MRLPLPASSFLLRDPHSGRVNLDAETCVDTHAESERGMTA